MILVAGCKPPGSPLPEEPESRSAKKGEVPARSHQEKAPVVSSSLVRLDPDREGLVLQDEAQAAAVAEAQVRVLYFLGALVYAVPEADG